MNNMKINENTMSKKSKKGFRVFLGFYLVTSVALLLIPGAMALMPNIDDKILHMIGFSVMAFLAINALNKPSLGLGLAVMISGTVFGGSTELLQGFTGRSVNPYDALANAVGIVIGCIAAAQFLAIMNKRKAVNTSTI